MVNTIETKGTNKFHGMQVISNYDCVVVKGHYVVEVNSSGNFVVRDYDKNGVEDDHPVVIEVTDFLGTDMTEANITGKIKREAGINTPLISEAAVGLIKLLVINCSR